MGIDHAWEALSPVPQGEGDSLWMLPLEGWGAYRRKQKKKQVDTQRKPQVKRDQAPPVAPTWAPSLHLYQELNYLHLAYLSSLCLPSASCKAQEMTDNPGWGCLALSH